MTPRRDDYAACGTAQRDAFTAAIAAGASDLQMRALFVVCNLTASWSKLTDRTSARRIAAAVYGRDVDAVNGGQRRRVRDALQWLADHEVIKLEGARGGPFAGVKVSLPAPNVLPRERDNAPSGEHVEQPGEQGQHAPAKHATCSVDDNNVFPTRGNTENLSEKSSEERERSLLEKIAKKFKSADASEWPDIVARPVGRGIARDVVLDAIEVAYANGARYPSEYHQALDKLRVPTDSELTAAMFNAPHTDPACTRCGGKGWYEKLEPDPDDPTGREIVTLPECDCKQRPRAQVNGTKPRRTDWEALYAAERAAS